MDYQSRPGPFDDLADFPMPLAEPDITLDEIDQLFAEQDEMIIHRDATQNTSRVASDDGFGQPQNQEDVVMQDIDDDIEEQRQAFTEEPRGHLDSTEPPISTSSISERHLLPDASDKDQLTSEVVDHDEVDSAKILPHLDLEALKQGRLSPVTRSNSHGDDEHINMLAPVPKHEDRDTQGASEIMAQVNSNNDQKLSTQSVLPQKRKARVTVGPRELNDLNYGESFAKAPTSQRPAKARKVASMKVKEEGSGQARRLSSRLNPVVAAKSVETTAARTRARRNRQK